MIMDTQTDGHASILILHYFYPIKLLESFRTLFLTPTKTLAI